MVKTQHIIEIVKGDRTYTFVMPLQAPLGEAYDAAFQVLKTVTELAYQAAEGARAKSLEEHN